MPVTEDDMRGFTSHVNGFISALATQFAEYADQVREIHAMKEQMATMNSKLDRYLAENEQLHSLNTRLQNELLSARDDAELANIERQEALQLRDNAAAGHAAATVELEQVKAAHSDALSLVSSMTMLRDQARADVEYWKNYSHEALTERNHVRDDYEREHDRAEALQAKLDAITRALQEVAPVVVGRDPVTGHFTAPNDEPQLSAANF